MRSRILMFGLLALFASIAVAGDHHSGHKGHGERTRLLCPKCTEPCYPVVTKGKETRHCWTAETKTICIPRVRWPWEIWGKDKGGCADGKCAAGKAGGGKCGTGKCGAQCPDVYCPEPKCGRTRVVNVLMKRSYECSVCKYSWDVSKVKSTADKLAPPKVYESAEQPATAKPVHATPVVHTR